MFIIYFLSCYIYMSHTKIKSNWLCQLGKQNANSMFLNGVYESEVIDFVTNFKFNIDLSTVKMVIKCIHNCSPV